MTKKTAKKDKQAENKGLVLLFKILKSIKKLSLILIFLVYLIMGLAGAWSWVNITQSRQIPLSELYSEIEAKQTMGDIKGALALLKFRSISENDGIIEMLLPHVSTLEPMFLFDLSQRYVIQGELDEALFWTMAGRFRLRYDALRCGHANAKRVSQQLAMLSVNLEVDDYLRSHPEKLKTTLQRVLDWDMEHPDIAPPNFFCDLLDTMRMSNRKVGPISSKRWDSMRETLHIVTQRFIDKKTPITSSDIPNINVDIDVPISKDETSNP